MLSGFYKSRWVLTAETLLLTIFPLVLLQFFPEWIHYRTKVFAIGLIYVAFFVWSQKISCRNFGCRFDNFFSAVKAILPFTILAISVTALLFYFLRPLISITLLIEGIHRRPSFVIVMFRYFFISVPLQEIIYRSYLINRVGLVSQSKRFIQGYSAVIFMLIHTPINNIFLTLGTLILGWLWVGHFLKYRNLFSVIVSHTVIGLVYLFLMING